MIGGDSNSFDNQLILTFLIITAVFYVGAYLSLDYFGYTFADVPTNGNVITPVINSIFGAITDAVDWFTSFSLFSITPFGWLSGVSDGFTALINQFLVFINVWNILNIYIFYLIFVPYAFITVWIIISLIIKLIEGLIP